MQKIKSLQDKRLFIWTIVLIVTILGGLATYIIYTSSVGSSETPGLDPRQRIKWQVADVVTEAGLAGTLWAPATGSDALIKFSSTKNNDPKHKSYDYQVAVDSNVQEVGFWGIKDNAVTLLPTKVYQQAQNISKIIFSGNDMLVYYAGSQKPEKWVKAEN